MPVRSLALAAGVSTVGVFTDVYTCPAGKTAILKDLRLAGGAVASTRSVVYVRSGPTAVFIVDQPQAIGEIVSRAGMFIVLEPGDDIGVFSTGSGFNFLASGAELDGVA